MLKYPLSIIAGIVLSAGIFKYNYPQNDVFPKTVFQVEPLSGLTMGSAFKVKYKGKVFILTAAHVCGDYTLMKVDHRFVSKVLYKNLFTDVCILSNQTELRAWHFKFPKKDKTFYMYMPLKGYGFDGLHPLVPRKLNLRYSNYKYNKYTGAFSSEVEGDLLPGNSGGPVIYNLFYVGGLMTRTEFVSSGRKWGIITHPVSIKSTLDDYLLGKKELTEQEYIDKMVHAPILINSKTHPEVTEVDITMYNNAKRHCWNVNLAPVIHFERIGESHYNVRCGRF